MRVCQGSILNQVNSSMTWQHEQEIYDDKYEIYFMDILENFWTTIISLASNSRKVVHDHKGKILTALLVWWMLYWPVGSYRWLYAWSDKLFQAKTLSLVNDILEKSGKVKKLPKNSQCDYSESLGWKIDITCNSISERIRMSQHNSVPYFCQDVKTNKDWYFDIQSGYCVRWEYGKDGRIRYLWW